MQTLRFCVLVILILAICPLAGPGGHDLYLPPCDSLDGDDLSLPAHDGAGVF